MSWTANLAQRIRDFSSERSAECSAQSSVQGPAQRSEPESPSSAGGFLGEIYIAIIELVFRYFTATFLWRDSVDDINGNESKSLSVRSTKDCLFGLGFILMVEP